MTFKEHFILMLVDKLFIGLIVGAAVYLSQKRLERFRSEQALQKEIAQRRVASVADGWKALNDWDFAVTKLKAGEIYLSLVIWHLSFGH